jgi:hypothetical protein
MIKHNSLEDRLNAVREGKPIPKPPMQPVINLPEQEQAQVHKVLTYKQFFITESYKLFNVIATSLLYGYGIRAIFSLDWNFIGTLGVGFLLNHTLTIILKLFNK